MLVNLHGIFGLDFRSKSKSSAETRSFNIFVDVFRCDRILHHFPRAEGYVSGGVEIGRPLMQGTLPLPPSFNFCDLDKG